VPFIEVDDRRELGGFGHLIRLDNNRKHRHLCDEELGDCGKEEG
jgi:hypothetical protein